MTTTRQVLYHRRPAGKAWSPDNRQPVHCSGYSYDRVKRSFQYGGETHEVEVTAHAGEMRILLGLRSTDKLPPDGLPPRLLPGSGPDGPVQILTWVRPYDPATKYRRVHRVICQCPGCHEEVPAGRLFSHLCKTRT